MYNYSQNVFASVGGLPTAMSAQSNLQQLAVECRSWRHAIQSELECLRQKVSTRFALLPMAVAFCVPSICIEQTDHG